MGVVHALFACLGLCFQSMSLLISLVALVAQIWLLARYTSRRSALFAKEGFSYAQSLGFIVSMGFFAGIVSGFCIRRACLCLDHSQQFPLYGDIRDQSEQHSGRIFAARDIR